MKQILLVALIALVVVGVGIPQSVYAQARNVTFVVNSATVPDTCGSGYPMQVRGNLPPLTWGNDTGGGLTNIGGDYWSVTLQFNAGDTLHFKIFAGTDGWEQNTVDVNGFNDGNRSYIVADRDTTLPVQFFNNDASTNAQYFRPWTTVPDTFMNVYFRVNMLGAEQAGLFGYADSVDGDSVGVRGGGPAGGDLNWAPTFYLTHEQPASNGGTFSLPARYFKSGRARIPKSAVTEGQTIEYKYLIGADWGRDELQGQANRNFVVPVGKKDTTIYFSYFNNTRSSSRLNSDTAVVTFVANLQRAIQTGGYSIGDTIVVRSGYFGTGGQAGTYKEKRMLRQGLTTRYQAVDTVTSQLNNTFDYQYYVIKNGVEVRENYYNFFYAGEIQGEAERRQVMVPSNVFTLNDTASSITMADRQPVFPNTRVLLRNVDVRWEVDLRPAYYQVLSGDTLFDIQGSFHVTDPDSVIPWGVWINGPATGNWATWGFTLNSDTTRKMWDDGTHGDQVANDSIFSRVIHYSPDSINIPSKGQVGQIYKFGIRGGDNEGGRGGFGNNHGENIDDSGPTFSIRTDWGSINPAFYDAWDYDNHVPVLTGVRETAGVPLVYELSQNYPNPFNPSTKINYTIPQQSFVTLKVYNILGQEVATLVNEVQKASKYVATFDAKSLASGVYFYKLQAGNFVASKKLLLLK
jgi:Secretion system C-terminal sorting domain